MAIGEARRAAVQTVGARVFAVDAARGFAIFAMVVAHTARYIQPAPKAVTLAEGLLNDLAAPLFALIIGVTITLTAPGQGSHRDRGLRGRYRLQTAIKGLALVGIGALLQLAPSGVAIVLGFLGVTMLCLVPLLYLRTSYLLCLAGLLTIVGPGITTYARTLVVTVPELLYPKIPVTVLLDWFVLDSQYQVPVFVAMALVGIVLGRLALGDRRQTSVVLAVSLVVFFVLQVWKSMDLPWSEIRGGYVEVLREAPLAIGAFAAIVLLTDLASARMRKVTMPVFGPFAVSGRMALSLYVLHVSILMLVVKWRAGVTEAELPWVSWPRGLAIQVGLILVCWAFAALWARFIGVGPVEWLMRLVSGRARSSRAGVRAN